MIKPAYSVSFLLSINIFVGKTFFTFQMPLVQRLFYQNKIRHCIAAYRHIQTTDNNTLFQNLYFYNMLPISVTLYLNSVVKGSIQESNSSNSNLGAIVHILAFSAGSFGSNRTCTCFSSWRIWKQSYMYLLFLLEDMEATVNVPALSAIEVSNIKSRLYSLLKEGGQVWKI